jgi:hypothetical protein
MRQFATAVVERKRDFTGPFDTHPYEAGWAAEALFFIHVEQAEGDDPRMTAAVQVSADGVNWVDEGTAFAPVTGPGVSFVRVTHFGGWLRLKGDVSGPGARFRATIQLVLKE